MLGTDVEAVDVIEAAVPRLGDNGQRPVRIIVSPLANLVPIDFNGAVGPDASETITDGFQVMPTELGATMPPLQLGDTIDDTAEIWRKLILPEICAT